MKPTTRKPPRSDDDDARNISAAAADALASLKELADPSVRDELGPRYGIHTTSALGVRVSHLHTLAKRLRIRPTTDDGRRYNHALAQAIWDLEYYDARMLAVLVDEPTLVTARQMDAWARAFDNWGICDTACFHLFDKVDPPGRAMAFARIDRWAVRDSARDEFVKRAAFALLASLALHDKALPDAPFVSRLALIRRAAADDRNFVKKGVSWALRSIGSRGRVLHARSVALAEELAGTDDGAARWVGRDALRDLTRPLVTKRVARKG